MNKDVTLKIALALLILSAVILFFVFDLKQYLSLEYLQNSKELFLTYYEENPGVVILSYFFIYVVSAAFSLPGAAILTLAGGALFGIWLGTLVVSFASTLGATAAMFISRFLLNDTVQTHFSKHLQTINDGIRKDGGFYLFTLRLVPAVPFFIVNLGMGLTPIRIFTFYWVSQLGMLPGTFVYVNAGAELSKIQSLSDIVSPTLLLSFALLGVFPLIVRKGLSLLEAKRN